MSLVHRISFALSFSVLTLTTGCVGPMAYGPGGSCGGPYSTNNCDGCGQCEGCGELYVDPWINEPADCCDPCDRCGNYNGQSCGKCRSVFDGFASLWGYRRDAGCNSCGSVACDGGCDSVAADGCCDTGGCDVGGCEPGCGCESCASVGGGVISNGMIPIASDPTPAKRITIAKPAPDPYKPRRTRQIFKPRGAIADGKSVSTDY